MQCDMHRIYHVICFASSLRFLYTWGIIIIIWNIFFNI